jgi:hypothetical protein
MQGTQTDTCLCGSLKTSYARFLSKLFVFPRHVCYLYSEAATGAQSVVSQLQTGRRIQRAYLNLARSTPFVCLTYGTVSIDLSDEEFGANLR